MREPWEEMVLIIKKDFTCHERYKIVHLYHIKFLQHIKGDCKLNLPYLFSRSLVKMVKGVKSKTGSKETSYFHQGLIKILIQ